MRTLRPLLFTLALGGLMLSQGGCLILLAGAGAGATVAYVKGDLETRIDADPKAVAAATEQAMKQMDISVISHAATGLDANVVGRTANDTKLEVTIKGETENTSKVAIRAGVFGDMVLQSRLLEKIKSNLGLYAPAPAKAETQTAETDPRD
jgi:hypothetical protein